MKDYFCGWYFKYQNGTDTLALIPAYHISNGRKSCSLQIVSDTEHFCVTFPFDRFCRTKTHVRIGDSIFGRDGIILNVDAPEVQARGRLDFGAMTPLAYDIMGPFRYVPFMECRHRVYSMGHRVRGTLEINGRVYEFENGAGYMEGDRGRSFPREYAWSQCLFPEGSLMVSAADIPLCGIRFTGVIGAVLYQGREYRFGTYLGARAETIENGELVIRQGKHRLTVRGPLGCGHGLSAPVCGAMDRVIREHPACPVYYRLEEAGRGVFEFEAANASFEYEYRR